MDVMACEVEDIERAPVISCFSLYWVSSLIIIASGYRMFTTNLKCKHEQLSNITIWSSEIMLSRNEVYAIRDMLQCRCPRDRSEV
jgi:hypothetical protein